MSHLNKHPGHTMRKAHLALGALLVGGILALVLWPASGWMSASKLAFPVGVVVVIHLGVLLAVSAGVITVLASRPRPRQAGGTKVGATLHSARLYDWTAMAYTLGREARLRERTLDAAGIIAGEHVLDVGCGTGTLTIAARKRVGSTGSVDGVDASPEMIARARGKALRGGLSVTFEIAAAQSLPFPDATFDVVLCSLAVHHLPQDAQAPALAEMRRVLKPGGRVLIVEFTRERRLSALLNPIVLLHALKNPRMLHEVERLMQRSGFQQVTIGALGVAGMGFAYGRVPAQA